MNLQWTKLPFVFDPAPLRDDILAIPPDAWVPHFNAADYAGEWSSISLRSRSGRSDDILPMGSGDDFHDTPLLQSSPALRAAVQTFQFPLKAVRLLRLHPGSRVKEHRDADLGLADGELRIHVPVMTSDQVEFIVANRRLPLRAGESWFIDFSQPHRIHNAGTEHRVHLVIDGTVNDWARDLLATSSRDIATETFTPSGIEQFNRFREHVYNDAALRQSLMSLSNPQDLLGGVVQAAGRLGFIFDISDAQSIFQHNRREWTMRTATL